MFQFERDKKSKGTDASHNIAHTIGLEEVLSSLSSSEFLDEQVKEPYYPRGVRVNLLHLKLSHAEEVSIYYLTQ